MTSATLPRFPTLDLDPRRIAATSATIAVHLLALMLLLAPMQSAPPKVDVDVDPPVVIIEEKKLPKPIPPPPIIRQVTRTPPRPTTQPPVMEQLKPEAVDTLVTPSDSANDDDGDIGPPVEITGSDPPSGPQILTILSGPTPTYPISALRQGIEGRVILRIEVDANGVPTGGIIETSSGSRLLDREALKFVLAKWRFVPAMYEGHPVAATALVPVDYVINQ
jgi:protein TonB